MRILLFMLVLLIALASYAAAPPDNYKSIAITQPANEATIQYDEGKVCININITPALKTGDKLALFLDGKSVGEQQQNASFCIYHVERGEHQIQAKVITPDNDLPVIFSQPITFFMHQMSNCSRRL
jgi:hypothetical protein